MNDVKLGVMRAFVAVLFVAVGCGEGPRPETMHDMNEASARRRATPEECQQLFNHLDRINRFTPVTAPDQGVFRGRNESPLVRLRFIDRCTRILSHGNWACLMRAQDSISADRCERTP